MTTQLSKAQQKRVAKLADAVTDTLDELFSDDLHVKPIESLGNATIGLLGSAKAGVHAIGIGLAHVRGLRQKHTIKQVDRVTPATKALTRIVLRPALAARTRAQ